MDAKKIVERYQHIAPYLGAAGTGAAIGGAVSDDRKKGAMRGALIGLGSLVGGRLAAKGGSIAANKLLGKNNLALAKAYKANLATRGQEHALIQYAVDSLNSAGKPDVAKKFVENLGTIGLPESLIALGEHRSLIKDIPSDAFAKLLSKESGIIGGAGTIGSTAGLAGTAYALRNDSNSKKK